MKITSAFVAVALLGCGAAFATTAPAASTATASVAAAPMATTSAVAAAPAPAPQMGTNSAMTPKAPAAPGAAPVAKQASLKACNKQADTKSLTGKDRSTFVKDCKSGKATG